MNPSTQLDTAGQSAMYGGAASAGIMWGMSLSEIAVLISAIVAVLGFILHTWATFRRDRREMEHHLQETEQHRQAMSAGAARGRELHEIHKRTARIEDKIDGA